MSGPVFTPRAVERELRSADKIAFGFEWLDDRKAIISSTLEHAYSTGGELPPFRTHQVRGKTCVSYTRHEHHLIHRVLSRHIAKRFRVAPLGRDYIVRAVLASLKDSTPMWILRRDLKSFYETVPTSAIKERLYHDTSIPEIVRRHVRTVFDQHCEADHGLPRGVGLAATLAELAMNDFDRAVRAHTGVYRYFRFSDDILVFSYLEPTALNNLIDSRVAEMGMALNAKKSRNLYVNSSQPPSKAAILHFEYLGYKFSFPASAFHSKPRPVRVSISTRKIARLKTRIILSLRELRANGNYNLFLQRMRYLSGNFTVERYSPKVGRSKKTRIGIFYNYRLCGQYGGEAVEEYDCLELKQLDGFFHSIVFGQSSEFAPAVQALPAAVQARLRRVSFFHGFRSRFTHHFPATIFSTIAEAWKYNG